MYFFVLPPSFYSSASSLKFTAWLLNICVTLWRTFWIIFMADKGKFLVLALLAFDKLLMHTLKQLVEKKLQGAGVTIY